MPPPSRVHLNRALATFDVAGHLLHRGRATPVSYTGPIIAELLRQSACWAALALTDLEAGIDQGGVKRDTWLRACTRAQVPDAEELWEAWVSKSPPEFWGQSLRLASLHAAASSLVGAAGRVERELDRVAFRRALWVGLVGVIVAISFGAWSYSNHQQAVARETSYPWTASSLLAGSDAGCKSPSQVCSEVRYFFHTNYENKPWIAFDLGRSARVRSVKVGNRVDCAECPERAVPMVLEVSSDQKHWKEVGRLQKPFDDAELNPKVKARWVRLRALRKTFLHFRQVRIETTP